LAKVLITGAAGFIGSHLLRALVARGDVVRGFDNFSTGKRENLEGVINFELVEGDLRDAGTVAEACRGMDFVLHQGALPSVPRSVKDPVGSHAVNVQGTLNLLEGARAAGVRRVVYAASSSAYGNQPGFPRVETMRPEPMSAYAVQKLTGELYVQAYWRMYGLETVCLRYFNIFGPRQDAGSAYAGVVARWIGLMLGERGVAQRAGEQPDATSPVIFGDGEQGRDFTYVENVVRANLLALESDAASVAGRVFNVACGERHTLNELYAMLAGLTGFARPPAYALARVGDVRDSLADVSAAREAMGYEVGVGFEEGLRRTVEAEDSF
jgi:nucleoside-diphosphate-sugar epimerase